MSGIYITGVEMPRDGGVLCIDIHQDGKVCIALDLRCKQIATAVPVPDHGPLIDLKAPFTAQYYDEMTEEWVERTVTVEDALYGCMVDEMPPTIIPAEEGEG